MSVGSAEDTCSSFGQIKLLGKKPASEDPQKQEKINRGDAALKDYWSVTKLQHTLCKRLILVNDAIPRIPLDNPISATTPELDHPFLA